MSKADLIDTPRPEWSEQWTASDLCRTLMGGTRAMRAKGEAYLPKKGSETDKEYGRRLQAAYLDNFYQKTITFYLGQVFKKELAYQSGNDDKYDDAFFDSFKENVDLAGNNLTVFGKQVFQAGLVDGVVFVLVDYVRVETEVDPETGRLMFRDPEDQAWKVKSVAVDERLKLRPYFIMVQASQVLDAWAEFDTGALTLRHFRYKEIIEVPEDEEGLDRKQVTQVIAWWPDRWEKWRIGDKGKSMVDAGPNKLGVIPVSWFTPGEPKGGLTARPPLDDLAELNCAYWAATADHEGRLMPYVRSPAFFAKCVEPPKGEDTLIMSPAAMIAASDPGASIASVGVDSASTVNSQNDLKEKREAMRDYGLQTVQAGVTATMSDNVATNAAASLKGWCADFKDCLENAHRHAALYQGQKDGPPISVNTEFKNTLDLNVLSHLYQAVAGGVLQPEYYATLLLSMMPYSDEWDVKSILNPDFGKEEPYYPPEFETAPRGPVAPAGAES